MSPKTWAHVGASEPAIKQPVAPTGITLWWDWEVRATVPKV
jgi:hypothetical protein